MTRFLLPIMLVTVTTTVLSGCVYDEPRRGDGNYNAGQPDRGYEQRGRDQQPADARRDDRSDPRSEQRGDRRGDQNQEQRGNSRY